MGRLLGLNGSNILANSLQSSCLLRTPRNKLILELPNLGREKIGKKLHSRVKVLQVIGSDRAIFITLNRRRLAITHRGILV